MVIPVLTWDDSDVESLARIIRGEAIEAASPWEKGSEFLIEMYRTDARIVLKWFAESKLLADFVDDQASEAYMRGERNG